MIGTYFLTGYQRKIIEVLQQIVSHGYGELRVSVSESRDYKTKVIVIAGCSYVYFVDKDTPAMGDIF